MEVKFAWFPTTATTQLGDRSYNSIIWLQKYEQHNGWREARRLGILGIRGRCYSVGRLYGD